MLKLYDPWETQQYRSFRWRANDHAVHFYASDLKNQLGLLEGNDFEDALERAFKVCRTLAISIEDNFKSVYRYNSTELVPDWKLSNLACYLIIVNANPENRNVAKAQVYYAMRK